MDPPVRRGRPHLDPRLFDALIAALLLIWLVLSFAAPVRAGQRPIDAGAWVLAVLLTMPYAAHRRAPFASLAVCLVGLIGYAGLHYAPYPAMSVFVLLFGITLHGRRRQSLVALGATTVALLVALAMQPPGVTGLQDWVSTLLAMAVSWLAADNIRQRRLRWAAMEERTRLLEREREERDRAAVSAERLRIARELHDVVAHSMSVIAVQAGVGRHLIDTDVASAGEALGVIESTSRGALVEMRRLLGVLRAADDTPEATRPAPGLADLPGLVSETRRAGLGVTLDVSGPAAPLPAAPLPAGVDLAAYRVVQEALTNTLKHGGPVAHVRIERTPDAVILDISDDGRPGPPAAAMGSGHGLLGMRERVLLNGGTFEAGHRPGGGFRVHAAMPSGALPGADVTGQPDRADLTGPT